MINNKNLAKKFVKVCCPRCNKSQITFGRATSKVKCQKCGRLLIKTTGGKSKIRAFVEEVLWK